MENCSENCFGCKHNRYDSLCKDLYCWDGLDKKSYETLTKDNQYYIKLHYFKLWTDVEIKQFKSTRCGKSFLKSLGGNNCG